MKRLFRLFILFPYKRAELFVRCIRKLGWTTGRAYYRITVICAECPPIGALLADNIEAELLRNPPDNPETQHLAREFIKALRESARCYQELMDKATGRDQMDPDERLMEELEELAILEEALIRAAKD